MRPGDGFIELADPAETLDSFPGETAFRGTPEGFPRTIGDLPGTPEDLRGTPRGLRWMAFGELWATRNHRLYRTAV